MKRDKESIHVGDKEDLLWERETMYYAESDNENSAANMLSGKIGKREM